MAVSLEVSGRAATRQTWRTRSVRDILTEIVAEKPAATEAEIYRSFVECCQNDEDDLEAVFKYAFANNYAALLRQRETATAKADRAQRAVARAAAYAETQARVAEAVQDIKSQVLLLNLEMPNGKRLRHCTGNECAAFGGWLRKLGKIKNKTVGSVYNESQLKALLAAQVRKLAQGGGTP